MGDVGIRTELQSPAKNICTVEAGLGTSSYGERVEPKRKACGWISMAI